MGNRESFLQRIREAVQAGNRPARSAALAPRGTTGYQGAGDDPLERFCTEFRNAGGLPTPVAGSAAAIEGILALVRERSAQRVLLGRGPLLDGLDLAERLTAQGVEVSAPDASRDQLFAADIGITEADFLVAETGSIVQRTAVEAPRSLSLLPPVHIVVANRAHLVPDLFDLFSLLGAEGTTPPTLPACVTLITGPSKTGDIELRLVTGVHGPGEVHVILLSE